MSIMKDLQDYEELSTYSNIRYTPAWYYKQFPGFYNIECYKILARHTQIIPFTQQDTPKTEDETMNDSPTLNENKKRA